ncbi:MAG: PIG-L family deacetylase [Deltaproteobacteria bacterium]|nr:MAG: PIG-L family deacetylase [Deltaproteobacteria bacterium]
MSSATRSDPARRAAARSLFLLLLALSAPPVRGDVPSQPAPATPLPILALPPHPRVLFFSPHPDDESLAAGGLIYRLVHAGDAVRVVFMTNGDGYPWAAQEDFHLKKPTDTDYLALGELRQREALAAAQRLGLAKRHVSFLGFPDGGLAELWRAHWSRTSPYTKEDSPPYPGTVDPNVDYDGQDLTSVIARLLRDFQPTVVIMPHPYDTHLDHAHTSYFVTEAVEALQARHVLPKDLLILTYLVHDPFWPPAPGTCTELPAPSASRVPDTTWAQVKLTPAEVAVKDEALARYRSQVEVMADLFHRFQRENELFGRVKSEILAKIAAVH